DDLVTGVQTCALPISAGERRVRFAAMAHYWKNREGVSGRGGLGAVLGSKNLKAVVVKGGRKTEVADAPGLKALIDQTREPLKTRSEERRVGKEWGGGG